MAELTSTKIVPLELNFNKLSGEVLTKFQAVASDGENNIAYIDMEKYEDRRVLILVRNAHADTVKDAWILGGNGLQAGANIDMPALAAANAEIYSCVLESGAYVNSSGDYKGCAAIKGESTDIQAAAIVLP